MSASEPPCVEVRPRDECVACRGLGLVCCMHPVKLGKACCHRLIYCRCATIIQHGELPNLLTTKGKP